MKIYSIADNIVSPLGFDTSRNFAAISNLQSGIKEIKDEQIAGESFFGARIDCGTLEADFLPNKKAFTRLEKMFITSIGNVLNAISGLDKQRLLLVISSTKGNVDLYDGASAIPAERIRLNAMARAINEYFGLLHPPVVVSNACISGLSAIITGKKLIEMGMYDHVLVSGGDLLSEFVISGFQSLKAISSEPCKPYDRDRTGISLGEACGTILLSNNPNLCIEKNAFSVVSGGGQSNDANHISGPSRTGKGLKIAIEKALSESRLTPGGIQYVNAHGTGTLFNDEMESLAFAGLGFTITPINSLKGYFGHTLGASGIVETIICIWQMNNGILFKSLGYEQKGVSGDIQVLNVHQKSENLRHIMKTASGFGGCNAALVLEKGSQFAEDFICI